MRSWINFGNMWWMLRIVGLLILCLALVGCTSSGGGEATDSARPTSSGPLSSSAWPTPTRTGPLTTGPGVKPGEKPPSLSASDIRDDAGGALSFASYFIDTINWSISTNDPYLVGQIAAPGCTTCARYIAEIREFADKNEHQVGGRLIIQSASVVTGTFAIKSDYVVRLTILQQGSSIAGPTETPGPPSADSTVDSLVFLSRSGGSWWVVEQGAPS